MFVTTEKRGVEELQEKKYCYPQYNSFIEIRRSIKVCIAEMLSAEPFLLQNASSGLTIEPVQTKTTTIKSPFLRLEIPPLLLLLLSKPQSRPSSMSHMYPELLTHIHTTQDNSCIDDKYGVRFHYVLGPTLSISYVTCAPISQNSSHLAMMRSPIPIYIEFHCNTRTRLLAYIYKSRGLHRQPAIFDFLAACIL